MRRRVELGLMLLLLIMAAACSSEPKQTQPVTSKTDSGTSTAAPAKEAGQRNKALVRVINAIPGNTSFDVYSSDEKVFESVAFKSVTPYKELMGERTAFRVRPAGQDTSQPVAENSEALADGKHYTVMIMPDTNDRAAIYLVNDNISQPSTDKAQVRVIHASPDAGEVDIVDKRDNKKLFSGVNFEADTHYTNVDPMKTTLEVRQEGQDKPILTVPNASFEKGKFYTIVVTGKATGMPKLQTLMIEDQLGTTPAAASNAQPRDEKMVKAKSKY
jgi:hypothetical protein